MRGYLAEGYRWLAARPGRGAGAHGGSRPRPARRLPVGPAARGPRAPPRVRGRERRDLPRARRPRRDVRRGRGIDGLPRDRQRPARTSRRCVARARDAARRRSARRPAADVGGAHARHRRLVSARILRRRANSSKLALEHAGELIAEPRPALWPLSYGMISVEPEAGYPLCPAGGHRRSSDAGSAAPRPPPTSSSTSPRSIGSEGDFARAGELIEESLARFRAARRRAGRGLRAGRARQPGPLQRRLRTRPGAARAQPRPAAGDRRPARHRDHARLPGGAAALAPATWQAAGPPPSRAAAGLPRTTT